MLMKSVLLLSLFVGVPLSGLAQTVAPQAAPESGLQRVTLYGTIAHGNDFSRALFSFRTGTFGQNWDLNFGSLFVNSDRDWFQVSTLKGVRTAFKDLGAHDWADSFKVPFVEPFPRLKEGEQRQVVVNVNGADGQPGRSAAPKEQPGPPVESSMESPTARVGTPSGTPGSQDSPGGLSYSPGLPERPRAPSRPRQDGVPRVDPIFTKAIPGHIYVIRVVDEVEDFYVLFRVESLVSGNNCTITWKRVPAPRAVSVIRK